MKLAKRSILITPGGDTRAHFKVKPERTPLSPLSTQNSYTKRLEARVSRKMHSKDFNFVEARPRTLVPRYT